MDEEQALGDDIVQRRLSPRELSCRGLRIDLRYNSSASPELLRSLSKSIYTYLVEGADALESAFKAYLRYRHICILKQRVGVFKSVLVQHFFEVHIHYAVKYSGKGNCP